MKYRRGVEITPYSNHNGTGAALRKAQHDVAKQVENCGIICTNDLVAPYEAANIHPCDKESVGNRLAYLALNRDYGFTRIACDAPEAVALSKMQGFGGFGRPGGNAAAANVPPMTRVEIVNCPHGIHTYRRRWHYQPRRRTTRSENPRPSGSLWHR